MTRKMLCALGLSLLSSTAVLAADWGFDDWDTDGDRLVNEHEFSMGVHSDRAWVENVQDDDLMSPEEWEDIELRSDVDFDDWDNDRDAALSADEYGRGLFEMLDQDDDGALSEAELEHGYQRGWLG